MSNRGSLVKASELKNEPIETESGYTVILVNADASDATTRRAVLVDHMGRHEFLQVRDSTVLVVLALVPMGDMAFDIANTSMIPEREDGLRQFLARGALNKGDIFMAIEEFALLVERTKRIVRVPGGAFDPSGNGKIKLV